MQTFCLCFINPKLLHEFSGVWASQPFNRPSSERVNETLVLGGLLVCEQAGSSLGVGESAIPKDRGVGFGDCTESNGSA